MMMARLIMGLIMLSVLAAPVVAQIYILQPQNSLDTFCNVDNKILKRVGGLWSCSDVPSGTFTAATCVDGNYSYYNGTEFLCSPDLTGSGDVDTNCSISGSCSNIVYETDTLNITQVPYIYNESVVADSTCGQRRLFNNEEETCYVQDGGNSLQDCLCNAPIYLRFDYNVRIKPSSYTGAENATIANVHGSDYFMEGIMKVVSDTSTYATVGSIHFSGFTGQSNPRIERLNFISANPTYTAKSQLNFFACQEAEVYDCSFGGTALEDGGSNQYGITTYGGITKIDGMTFYNGTDYAFNVKQGGRMIVKDSKGNVTRYPYMANQGDIIRGCGNDMYGDDGKYKYWEGYIFSQEDCTNGENGTLWGVHTLGSTQQINFLEFTGNGNDIGDTDALGFYLLFDGSANEFYLKSINWGHSVQNRITWTRDDRDMIIYDEVKFNDRTKGSATKFACFDADGYLVEKTTACA